jgi:TolB-like protein
MRCLEKKPADRWQTAEDLLTQLELFATLTTGITPTQVTPTTAGATPTVARGGLPNWMKVVLPVAAAGIGAAIWMRNRGASTETEQRSTVAAAQEDVRERLLVLPLRNLTTDPDLDVWGTLATDQMARAVDQAGPVAVVPSTSVTDAIRSLGEAASTDAVSAAIGATHAFAGTVARVGGQIRFEVELLDVRSGERLRTLEPVVGPVDSTETLVSALAQQAAAVAVAHLDPDAPAWVAAYSVPVSLTAYQSYLEQADRFCSVDYLGSIEAGKRSLASPGTFQQWSL